MSKVLKTFADPQIIDSDKIVLLCDHKFYISIYYIMIEIPFIYIFPYNVCAYEYVYQMILYAFCKYKNKLVFPLKSTNSIFKFN